MIEAWNKERLSRGGREFGSQRVVFIIYPARPGKAIWIKYRYIDRGNYVIPRVKNYSKRDFAYNDASQGVYNADEYIEIVSSSYTILSVIL